MQGEKPIGVIGTCNPSEVLTSNLKGKLGIPVNQSILRKTLENLEIFYHSIFNIQFLNERTSTNFNKNYILFPFLLS